MRSVSPKASLGQYLVASDVLYRRLELKLCVSVVSRQANVPHAQTICIIHVYPTLVNPHPPPLLTSSA
jgi:hypothetical protein